MFGKIQIKNVVIAGFIYLIIQTVLRQIEVAYTLQYYKMPQYAEVWGKLMMPKAGPPPANFLIMALIFSFLTGLILAVLYDFLKKILAENYWGKVVNFTILIVLLSLVFSYLPMLLTINLPFELVLSWFATGTLAVFLGTMVFAKIIK